MAKVYSLHKISLRPEVNAEEFERFVTKEHFPAWNMPGVTPHLLRGERGDREGSYLLMMEFDSIETRDDYAPVINKPSEKMRKIAEVLEPLMKKWHSFAFNFVEPLFTDYVEVE